AGHHLRFQGWFAVRRPDRFPRDLEWAFARLFEVYALESLCPYESGDKNASFPSPFLVLRVRGKDVVPAIGKNALARDQVPGIGNIFSNISPNPGPCRATLKKNERPSLWMLLPHTLFFDLG